jgi:enoyl-CoA hydratase/carnithine racemase
VNPENYLTTAYDAETQLLVITLDRQDNAKNQIDTGMVRALLDVLYAELINPRARGVLLLSGKEKVFSTGADIEGELKDLNAVEASRFAAAGREVFSLLTKLAAPTVALLNGFVLGGGLELALCCDFRIAVKTARLGLPEINLGVIPGWGGTQRLQRLVGRSRALKMILSGDPVKASLAEEYGLVDELVDDYSELAPAGEKLLRKFCAKSRNAIGLAKRAVVQGGSGSLEDGLRLESELFALAWSTDDRREGISAYLEKRKPVWPE